MPLYFYKQQIQTTNLQNIRLKYGAVTPFKAYAFGVFFCRDIDQVLSWIFDIHKHVYAWLIYMNVAGLVANYSISNTTVLEIL